MKSSESRSYDDIRDELHLNLDLWKHEEGVRQQRNTVLLGTNVFLAVAAGAVVSAEPPLGAAFAVGLVLAAFGLLVCSIWRRLQRRHVVYAEFRRCQIRELAAQLGYESWENHWTALRTPPNPPPVSVYFATTETSFSPRGPKGSAIVAESLLPTALAAVWGIAVIAGILFAILHYFISR